MGLMTKLCWYVGAEAVEYDGKPFDEMLKRLTAELSGQFEKSKGAIRGDAEEYCRIGIKIWNTVVLDGGCFEMNNKEKHLEGTDIILNLGEIAIHDLDSF